MTSDEFIWQSPAEAKIGLHMPSEKKIPIGAAVNSSRKPVARAHNPRKLAPAVQRPTPNCCWPLPKSLLQFSIAGARQLYHADRTAPCVRVAPSPAVAWTASFIAADDQKAGAVVLPFFQRLSINDSSTTGPKSH